MIITIDGPAGSGKSTAARALAGRLGLRFLDTGAMYRAITLRALRLGLDLRDEQALQRCAAQADLHLEYRDHDLRVRLDGQDVTAEIRRPEVTDHSHYIASAAGVRAVLVAMQRRIAAELAGGVVTEGRDQGSVVFPDADVKFYLTADPAERARRRCQELRAAGQDAPYERILEAIQTRDRRDRGRAVAPLVRPAGAIEVDNTGLSPDQTAERLARYVAARRVTSYPNPRLRTWRPPRGTPPNLLYRAFRALFQTTFAAIWQTRVFNRRYEPAEGPVVYICNHQSFLDPILMSMALRRPMNYMARDSLFRLPGLGRLIPSLNAFAVRRGTGDTAALKEALRRIQAGGQVVVFAEGTRTRDGRIGPLLPGVALLARRAGAVTVPVVIDGAFECWPRWQPLPVPGHTVVQYGPPIGSDEARALSAEAFVARVREELIAIQSIIRRRLGRPPLDYGTAETTISPGQTGI